MRKYLKLLVILTSALMFCGCVEKRELRDPNELNGDFDTILGIRDYQNFRTTYLVYMKDGEEIARQTIKDSDEYYKYVFMGDKCVVKNGYNDEFYILDTVSGKVTMWEDTSEIAIDGDDVYRTFWEDDHVVFKNEEKYFETEHEIMNIAFFDGSVFFAERINDDHDERIGYYENGEITYIGEISWKDRFYVLDEYLLYVGIESDVVIVTKDGIYESSNLQIADHSVNAAAIGDSMYALRALIGPTNLYKVEVDDMNRLESTVINTFNDLHVSIYDTYINPQSHKIVFNQGGNHLCYRVYDIDTGEMKVVENKFSEKDGTYIDFIFVK